jgi:ABC-2 type transport system permease protein
MTGTRWLAAASKYTAFARVGFASAQAEPAELCARMLFLVMILGVFASLWHAVAATGASVGGDPRTLVWYLAMTEWVLMSVPHVHFRMEDDVRRGDVAYQIARPASYLGGTFAEAAGALAVRAPVLLGGACMAAWIFAGPPTRPLSVARTIAFGAGASLVLVSYNMLLGITAFWFGDIAPVYWIWQKLTFVLGGLLLPLTLYPDLVVRIARYTPFPALLAGPASFVLERPIFGAGTLVLVLLGWAAVATLIGSAAFRGIARRLQLNGG